MDKKISQAVIRRLPRYYRYLGELLDDGVERISSNDLSKRMHVTASQIRQDLNNFGGFGQQGYGYSVRQLKEEITNILGLNHTKSSQEPLSYPYQTLPENSLRAQASHRSSFSKNLRSCLSLARLVL